MDEMEHMPIQRCISGCEIKALSDIDLIAVILITGGSDNGVLDLAAKIFTKFRGLHGIRNSGLRELSSLKGVGLKKAIRLQCALEMGRRASGTKAPGNIIDSPRKAWQQISSHISCLMQEEFMVLILDNKNQLVRFSVISRGTINQTVIHPREIFRDAIRETAASIIVAHNHPSGILTPSDEDIKATKRLKSAGEIIGITVLDHIIVSGSSYLSLKEEGYFK